MLLTESTLRATLLSLAILSPFYNAFAFDPAFPDPNYWRPPYAFKVTIPKNDTRPNLPKYLLLATPNTLRADLDPKLSYGLWPTKHPFSNKTDETVQIDLFPRDKVNWDVSPGLAAYWTPKLPSLSGSPLMELGMAPSSGKVWTTPRDIIYWGDWYFIWDAKTNTARLGEFKMFTHPGGVWKYILANNTKETWKVYAWNGTTPEYNSGWGPDFFRIIDPAHHVESDIEIVPLWTLKGNTTFT